MSICTNCARSNKAVFPANCSYCEEPIPPSTEAVASAQSIYRWIKQRAEQVASLHGFGSEDINIESDYITVRWETSHCGCCGSEEHYESFPISMLWETDAAIKAKLQAEAEAKKLAEEHAARLKKLKEAEERVKYLATRVASVQTETQTALQQAEAQLAALRTTF